VVVERSVDDGIQFTELGEGRIDSSLYRVTAIDNAKYGIKMEQWVEEDEAESAEDRGKLKVRRVSLSANGSGDEIGVNNIVIDD
jgi:hypothetical protein